MNGSSCDGLVVRGSGLEDMIVRGRVMGWNSSGMFMMCSRLSNSWVVICEMVLSWWCVSEGDILDISWGVRSDSSGMAMVGSLVVLYLAYIAYVVRLVFCMIVSMIFMLGEGWWVLWVQDGFVFWDVDHVCFVFDWSYVELYAGQFAFPFFAVLCYFFVFACFHGVHVWGGMVVCFYIDYLSGYISHSIFILSPTSHG